MRNSLAAGLCCAQVAPSAMYMQYLCPGSRRRLAWCCPHIANLMMQPVLLMTCMIGEKLLRTCSQSHACPDNSAMQLVVSAVLCHVWQSKLPKLGSHADITHALAKRHRAKHVLLAYTPNLSLNRKSHIPQQVCKAVLPHITSPSVSSPNAPARL